MSPRVAVPTSGTHRHSSRSACRKRGCQVQRREGDAGAEAEPVEVFQEPVTAKAAGPTGQDFGHRDKELEGQESGIGPPQDAAREVVVVELVAEGGDGLGAPGYRRRFEPGRDCTTQSGGDRRCDVQPRCPRDALADAGPWPLRGSTTSRSAIADRRHPSGARRPLAEPFGPSGTRHLRRPPS